MREQRIMIYLKNFATEIDLSRAKLHEIEWQRYCDIKKEIMALMREADHLAAILRMSVTK